MWRKKKGKGKEKSHQGNHPGGSISGKVSRDVISGHSFFKKLMEGYHEI
jgi:hypothetical protein